MFKRLMALICTGKEDEAEQPQSLPPYIQEPVLGFVRTVKASPKRFQPREEKIPVSAAAYKRGEYDQRRHQFNLYDKVAGISFNLVYEHNRLFRVHGVDFQLNAWEREYLHKELAPIFGAVYDRAMRINGCRTIRLRKEAEAADAIAREKWTKIYN